MRWEREARKWEEMLKREREEWLKWGRGAEGWSVEKEVQEWKKEAVKWQEEVQRLREMMWLDLGGGRVKAGEQLAGGWGAAEAKGVAFW